MGYVIRVPRRTRPTGAAAPRHLVECWIGGNGNARRLPAAWQELSVARLWGAVPGLDRSPQGGDLFLAIHEAGSAGAHSRRWNAQRYRHARARARGPSVSPGAGHHPGQDVVSALDPGGLCKAAYGNEASRIRVQSIALEPHKQKLAYKFPGARFSRVHDFLRTILSC